ncbi:uncharacterized protein LOC135579816, partial [Columba livia]|uniref:uncharacterized protein LOC135579816 n=1 Tax=Columba livia TaxID=8932 RepID=UPI0031B9E33B
GWLVAEQQLRGNEEAGCTSGGGRSTHGTSKGTHGTSKSTHGTSRSTHGTSKGTHGTSKGTHGTSKGTHGTSKSTHGTFKSTHGTSKSTHGTSKGTHGTSKSTHGTSKGTHGTSKGTHGTSKGTHGTSKGTHGTSKSTHGTFKGTHGTSKGTHGTSKGTHGTSKGTHGTSKSTHGTSKTAELERTLVVQAALPGRSKRLQTLYNPLSTSSLFQHSQLLMELVRDVLSTSVNKEVSPLYGRVTKGIPVTRTTLLHLPRCILVALLSTLPTLPHHAAPRPKHSNRDIFSLLSSLIFQMPLQIPISPNANSMNKHFFFFFFWRISFVGKHFHGNSYLISFFPPRSYKR